MKRAILLLLILLFCAPFASSQESWCGLNTIYFQHSVSPDIPGYEELRNYPSGLVEVNKSVSITSASGTVLIGTYITPPGEPAVYALLPGYRRYRTYHWVDKDQGDTRFIFRPFLYHIDGTNTSLYEVMTSEVDASEPTEYLTSYVIANYTQVQPTDRIGISVLANTTSATEIQAFWVYEGAAHYSHIDAGYYSCEAPIPTQGPIINPSTYHPADWWQLIVDWWWLLAFILFSIWLLMRW
jgi:hypothetical protein